MINETQPPINPTDPRRIQANRREALYKARESGALTISAAESQRLTDQAHSRAKAETNPDRLLEAPHSVQHAAHIAIEQVNAGEEVVPIAVDHSGNIH
jgi:hypothetical protein